MDIYELDRINKAYDKRWRKIHRYTQTPEAIQRHKERGAGFLTLLPILEGPLEFIEGKTKRYRP